MRVRAREWEITHVGYTVPYKETLSKLLQKTGEHIFVENIRICISDKYKKGFSNVNYPKNEAGFLTNEFHISLCKEQLS